MWKFGLKCQVCTHKMPIPGHSFGYKSWIRDRAILWLLNGHIFLKFLTLESWMTTHFKGILAFIKNGTPLLIRLKVPFSSSLFLAIRVKKLQCTFSSRLNSFAMNSNKVLIDFTQNFAHSAPVSLSVKKFFAYAINIFDTDQSEPLKENSHTSEPIRNRLL